MISLSDQEIPGRGVVHVWTIDLEEAALDLPELLSDDEITRFSSINHKKARLDFLRSRACLRLILASYLGVTAADIVFSYNENGKPELALSGYPSLSFNLSHSDKYCLLAVAADSEIGVDVERVQATRDYHALARRFFTPSEFQLIRNAQDEGLFYRMWVLKEASVKARGMQLLAGLDRFKCNVSKDGTLKVTDKLGQDDPGNWSVRQWQPDGQSSAALVVRDAEAEFVEKTLAGLLTPPIKTDMAKHDPDS
jgi:4'-phosphopantetheinyl transferase